MFDMSLPLSYGRLMNQYCPFQRHYDVLGSPDMTFFNFCILSKTIVMNQF